MPPYTSTWRDFLGPASGLWVASARRGKGRNARYYNNCGPKRTKLRSSQRFQGVAGKVSPKKRMQWASAGIVKKRERTLGSFTPYAPSCERDGREGPNTEKRYKRNAATTLTRFLIGKWASPFQTCTRWTLGQIPLGSS